MVNSSDLYPIGITCLLRLEVGFVAAQAERHWQGYPVPTARVIGTIQGYAQCIFAFRGKCLGTGAGL